MQIPAAPDYCILLGKKGEYQKLSAFYHNVVKSGLWEFHAPCDDEPQNFVGWGQNRIIKTFDEQRQFRREK